eukprot:ANDGO_03487.mRNA.1 Eukaryotic peptide chain release factor subunit 1
MLFHFDESQHASCGLVKMDGHECVVGLLTEGRFVVRKTVWANIAKRHKKGGQSSLRFARLAEESRQAYVQECVDAVHAALKPDYPIFAFGSEELLSMLLASKACLVELIRKQAGPSVRSDSPFGVAKSTVQEWMAAWKEQHKETPAVERFQELVHRHPDMLVFGVAEALQHAVDCRSFICTTQVFHTLNEDPAIQEKCVEIRTESPHYAWIRAFGIVGLRFSAAPAKFA